MTPKCAIPSLGFIFPQMYLYLVRCGSIYHIGERQEAQILKFNAPPLHT